MPASRVATPSRADLADEIDLVGGYLQGRWTCTISEMSDMSLQMYYSTDRRTEEYIKQTDDTYDLDFQHRFQLTQSHEIIWGLGYRFNSNLYDNDSTNSSKTYFIPGRRKTDLYSGFIQDDIALIEDRLSLTVGTKLEHNYYTGLEFLPSTRLSWTPNDKNTIWAAVSRAVRTPSRLDHDLRNEVTTPFSATLSGNDHFDSEELMAYELGYRIKPADTFFVDIATFYNDYDQLRTIENEGTSTQTMDNKMTGETYGGEVTTNWKVTDNWKLAAGYTYTQIQLHPDASSTSGNNTEGDEYFTPHNQANLRSYLDLPGHLELDTMLYYVDHMVLLGQVEIPSYIRLDVRLGWHINDRTELSVIGKNLLDDKHSEMFDLLLCDLAANGVIERSFFVNLTHRF